MPLTQTRPLLMQRGDTTTQTRRRSTISEVDRPGETGGDAAGGGHGAVGVLCQTLIGYKTAWEKGWQDLKKRDGQKKRWKIGLVQPRDKKRLSLLSDPSWTSVSYTVQIDYFTDNFVPCSISFVCFMVFFQKLVGLIFFFPPLVLHLIPCCFWLLRRRL